MRLHVATKEGTVTVDVPQEATSRDLTSRVLASASQDGASPAEAARHYLVCDGRKLKDTPGVSGQETPLLAQGVSDGSTLVLFKRRMPPANTDGGQITHPSLEQIERVVRAEAERQGREVVAPAQPAESNRGIAPLETRLHDIMQALQNMSSQGLNDPEMQRHVTQALRTAARIPAGAEPPINEEVVVPEPNPTHIAQLGDMGFSAAAARRALLLNRNAVNAAANYLLAHGGDGDIEAEPTEQELRQVYRARNVRLAQPRQVEALPELLEQLTAMGFSEAGSRHALVRNDNNLDSALNLLTSMAPGWEPAPEPAPQQAPDAQQSGDAAEAPVAGSDAVEGSNTEQQAENEQPATTENRTSASGDQAAAESVTTTSATTREVPGATEQAEAEEGESAAGAAAVEAATRAIRAAAPSASASDLQYDDASGMELLLGGNQRAAATERGSDARDDAEENQGDGQEDAVGQGDEGERSDEELLAREDGEDYQVAQEDFLRRSEQLLDDISILDLQEGMRGIMNALGGGAGGVGAEDGNRMSGALPILSTGSGQGGIMDPLRLVDDMRWGNGFPGMLGGLMDDSGDGGELDEDDEFNDDEDDDEDDDGFHTETTYDEDEDDPDDEDVGEGEDEDDGMEQDEAEEDDDGLDNSATGSVTSEGSPASQ